MVEKFAGDQVDGWTPITFSAQFVITMRKQKRLTHKPSLRTAIAIPKLLTARYFRRKILQPKDYIEAAVFNTPYEDQAIAERVATEILFPPTPADPKGKSSTSNRSSPTQSAPPDDPMASILASLAQANISLDDIESLDSFLNSEEPNDSLQAYDLFDKLISSTNPIEKSLGELLSRFGGPNAMELAGINTLSQCQEYAKSCLQQHLGSLNPEDFLHGCQAGFGDMLVREAKLPWELAAALAGAGTKTKLSEHMDDILSFGSTRDIGKSLRYLQVFSGVLEPEFIGKLRNAGVDRAQHLADFASLLDGLNEWIAPSESLVRTSSIENPNRALQSADWIRERFGQSLHARIFDYWRTSLDAPPTLQQLAYVSVSCTAWEQELDAAYRRYLEDIASSLVGRDLSREGPSELVIQSVVLTETLYKTGNVLASNLAGIIATEVLCCLDNANVFLIQLDAYLEHHVRPIDLPKLIDHAERIGLNASEVYDRLGNALDQFHDMVIGNTRGPQRYAVLATRIDSIPSSMMGELAATCHQTGNLEAMAVLVAVDLAAATQQGLPAEFVISSICFKGIGGGSNLLKQWFSGHDLIPGEIRLRIKELAKNALVELGLDWASRGDGSCTQGLIPQNQTRPFGAADDLDQLDIENTLDAIVSEGKRLDELRDEHLLVNDSQSGKASLGVLIDISGSMSGAELSICATAVVMLLGKLQSQEIAIALFESDTHVIKGFADEQSLDEVADRLLELKATGGTCVDAALRWVYDQFDADFESDRQILFLLSDYCFFEKPEELRAQAQQLADQHVHFLGAAHGPALMQSIEPFLETMGGEMIRLKRFEDLPTILNQAISSIGK